MIEWMNDLMIDRYEWTIDWLNKLPIELLN